MGQMNQEEITVNLFDEVKRQKEEIESLKMALWSCRYHAQRIIEKDYGESMNADDIVKEVNSVLGE